MTGWGDPAGPGSGQIIGSGWGELPHVFPGPSGGIYVVKYSGELLWYEDLKKMVQIGPKLFTRFANGVVARRIGVDWRLPHWYKDLLRDGSSEPGGYGWAQNRGAVIGKGWVQAPSGPPSQPAGLGNTGQDGGEQPDPDTTVPDGSDGWPTPGG